MKTANRMVKPYLAIILFTQIHEGSDSILVQRLEMLEIAWQQLGSQLLNVTAAFAPSKNCLVQVLVLKMIILMAVHPHGVCCCQRIWRLLAVANKYFVVGCNSIQL